MIQDRIVVELRNRTQSERTPDESQTHTGEAKMLMRQWETLHEQKQILKQSGDRTFAAVHWKPHHKGNCLMERKSQHSKKAATPMNTAMCTSCGRKPCKRQQCPARDTTFVFPYITEAIIWKAFIIKVLNQGAIAILESFSIPILCYLEVI